LCSTSKSTFENFHLQKTVVVVMVVVVVEEEEEENILPDRTHN
jgi:hypothetical protein